MDTTISFKERAKLGLKELSKQMPVTLESAIEQAKNIASNSTSTHKKNRGN